MKIFQCNQGSADWWDVRRGYPTASNFSRILTAAKAQLSAQAEDYAAELAADVACLLPNWFSDSGRNKPPTEAMRHGTECEPEARKWYEMETGCTVSQVGFLLDDAGRFGCSPDGLICLENGSVLRGLELKSPMLKTQATYLLKGKLPDDYKAQVHGALVVTGCQSWDFVSYCPGLEPLMLRIEPDEYTEKLRKALDGFHALYDGVLTKLLGHGFTEAMNRLHPNGKTNELSNL